LRLRAFASLRSNLFPILQKRDIRRRRIWQTETIEIMKTKLGILIFLLAATLAHAQTNNLTALLQQGLFEEQANRNLDAAIADYQALARQFDKDRQLAATAVFRLGECYRMQGKTNEAALEYKRIVNEFSDQTTLATLSRQNLTGMGMSPVPAASAALQTQKDLLAKQIALAQQDLADAQRLYQSGLVPQDKVRTAEKEMLRLQQQLAALDSTASGASGLLPPAGNSDAKLWDSLKNLPHDRLEATLPTLVPDAGLTQLLQQRADAETKLAELQTDFSTNNPTVMKQKAGLDVINKQISERINGIMQALKMRAELSQTSVATGAPTGEEDQEIQRIQTMIRNSPDLINALSNGDTPLGNVAAHGWLKAAAFLLDHGADVNGGFGSALFIAAQMGNRAMVELLLSRGAQVNADEQDTEKNAPLHIAVQNGFQAVIEVLLTNKADVDARTRSGSTPLLLAAQRNNPKILSLLLEHKADVNARDDAGRTPLTVAAAAGKLDNAKLLLAAGANPNVEDNRGRTPLSYAAEKFSPEIVEMLLAAKADPNGGKLDAPLFCAIFNNDIASAELLLQAGAKPNSAGDINFSVQPGFGGGRGGRVGGGRIVGGGGGFGGSSRSVTPLWLAISENQFPMVQLLLKFKADPNDIQTGDGPLLFTSLDKPEIVKALLDAGANPNARRGDSPNPSLLQMAAGQNLPESVALLLQHGASPNATDPVNNTALHFAAYQLSDEKVFTLLLDHNANPNVRNNEGKTPLDIVKQYLQNDNSRPARFDNLAAKKAQAEKLIALLHQHGALDNLPDWDSITVSRPSADFSKTVFQRHTNDWNHFSLLELLNRMYPSDFVNHPDPWLFPDLTRIVISRPSASGLTFERIEVHVLNALGGVDCARDLPLQFGDVVEIPEREHSLGEPLTHLSDNQRKDILNCLRNRAGEAKLVVADHPPVQVPLDVGFQTIGNVLGYAIVQATLTSSSDLSRVKVTRRDPKTGKTEEWILDCSNRNNPGTPDLWLRGGDVIEVPGKP
jgi:ankyrin repeat protein